MIFCKCINNAAVLTVSFFFAACHNSENLSYAETMEEEQISSSSAETSLLADFVQSPIIKTYPYAGIPRLVVETENLASVNDRETEIPAKMRFWRDSVPETDVMKMTIRGRGNFSWTMPQKSYKIEFADKQSLLGMPKDKEWALIANYADKSLMKNYLMYRLSAKLNMFYSPRCEYVELFLNNEYLGVYLLTETIKKSKYRVNISQDENAYIVEFDQKYRDGEIIFFSDVIKSDENGMPFRIHEPKNPSTETLDTLETYIRSFEEFLKNVKLGESNGLEEWLDIDSYIKHYWLQEFPKNPDAVFYSSVYFAWTRGKTIKMGPIWDYDLSLGGHRREHIRQVEGWHVKYSYWNTYVFQDTLLENARVLFWQENKEKFLELLTEADSLYWVLEKAARNNFRRWNILKHIGVDYHFNAYETYREAVEDLKKWIGERYDWIESQMPKG